MLHFKIFLISLLYCIFTAKKSTPIFSSASSIEVLEASHHRAPLISKDRLQKDLQQKKFVWKGGRAVSKAAGASSDGSPGVVFPSTGASGRLGGLDSYNPIFMDAQFVQAGEHISETGGVVGTGTLPRN